MRPEYMRAGLVFNPVHGTVCTDAKVPMLMCHVAASDTKRGRYLAIFL
jgi:hypothetical protein